MLHSLLGTLAYLMLHKEIEIPDTLAMSEEDRTKTLNSLLETALAAWSGARKGTHKFES